MLRGISIYEADNWLTTLYVPRQIGMFSHIIKDVQGLGPVKADVVSSTYANQDGGILQATRTGTRNIAIKVGYRPDYLSNQTVQDLRLELYKYLAPKREVTLHFLDTERPTVKITGVVESHEPVIFSQDPEVLISILCPDPNFKALEPIVLNGYNNLPMYPSAYGSSTTGFEIEIFISRALSAVRLTNGVDDDIVYTATLVQDDVLKLSTVRGSKHATLVRAGTNYNTLDNITSGGLGMVFGPDTDEFEVVTDGANNILIRVTFTPSYVGI